MTLDRFEVLGLTLFAIGALILLVSMGVRTYRTNQFSAAVDRYSREVDEALVLADAAAARGDYAEAQRILQGPKRPERPAVKPHYVWSWKHGGWIGPYKSDGPRVIYRYEHDARWIGRGFWEAFDIGFEMLCASGALA